jgi:hypothetical protein
MPLTHASLPHMTTWGVIMVAPKSKRRDVTQRHCASHSVGSEPEAVQVPRGHALASGCMVIAPIFLWNIKIRGKSLKTVSKYLRIKTINNTNIMKVIGSHKRFNAFIIIIYT